MEPQNKKERSRLILRFLVLFIIAVLLVTIPFYFTIRLPAKENRRASEELLRLQKQLDFQRDYFAVRMDSVKHLLDTYKSEDVDVDKLNADIGFLLSKMEQSFAADTSWRFDMYENIIQTYLSIKKTQNSLMKVSSDLAKCRSRRTSAPKRPTDSLDPE
ncbi:MAG: hypothetical protein KAT15_07360 [Bacteroidales bacterium]|nr:hypothetical protein [Bacteroidales bacterium]